MNFEFDYAYKPLNTYDPTCNPTHNHAYDLTYGPAYGPTYDPTYGRRYRYLLQVPPIATLYLLLTLSLFRVGVM